MARRRRPGPLIAFAAMALGGLAAIGAAVEQALAAPAEGLAVLIGFAVVSGAFSLFALRLFLREWRGRPDAAPRAKGAPRDNISIGGEDAGVGDS